MIRIKKDRILLSLMNIFMIFLLNTKSNNAVVQLKSQGRFGDNIMAFAHAVYFSQKNNYDLLYDPFIYSDQLVLSDVIKVYYPDFDEKFSRVVEYPGGSPIIKKTQKNTLYKIPYFPESSIEYKGFDTWKAFHVDWQDKKFKNTLRKLIAPKQKLNLIYPPKNKISVAIHLRKGGGYDKFDNINSFYSGLITYKIPYEQYYINQIKRLSELLGNVPIYVFLFTDEQDVQALRARFISAVNLANIEFDARNSLNRHDLNVLEDFFSITNFDMLIRSESNFSFMAEKLGDFSIVISPDDLEAGQIIHKGLLHITDLKKTVSEDESFDVVFDTNC